MTRVLYWNIQDFAIKKISDPSTRPYIGQISHADASRKRASLIRRVIRAANPDIVIVVEVETAYRGPGQLVTGAGARGAILLARLIQRDLGSDWLLVPPLQTGPNEAVAVYYDFRSVQFSGPDVWPGGAAGVAAPGVTPGDYPDEFDGLLAVDPVPSGSLWNAGVLESHVAARVHLRSDASPDRWLDWQGSRAPYMVTFWDLHNSRNLAFFAIHAPATNERVAKRYMLDVTGVADIAEPPRGNEARVVVGDFNVNLLNANLGLTEEYTDLRDIAGYRLLLAPDPAAQPDPRAARGYRGYFATHIKRTWSAGCASSAGATAYYPGYHYTGGDDFDDRLYAIDNAFVRYGRSAGDPGDSKMTILNPVVGSPFGVVDPTPFNAPAGRQYLERECWTPPPPPPVDPPVQGPPHSAGLFNAFNAWNNYGYIRSTSDHLPLTFVV